MRRLARLSARVLLVPALLLAPALAGARGTDGALAAAVTTLAARWETTAPPAPGQVVRAVVSVEGSPGRRTELVVSLAGVRVVGVPAGCAPSGTRARSSSVSAGGDQLVCVLERRSGGQEVVVTGRVSAAAGGVVRGTASAAGVSATLPDLGVGAGAAAARRLRLLSSPDFLNADVGNLGKGPGFWKRKPRAGRSINAVNDYYRRSLDTVLDDWASLGADGVLVAGDLVEGRWSEDSDGTGNFGPLRSQSERKQAIRRAARTFYPQWKQRFSARGLAVYPAIGDHEIGDNPWPAGKRSLVATYRQEFARAFTRDGSTARFVDHPRGPHAGTAYAFRPSPQIQVVSLDPFDIDADRSRLRVSGSQLTWLEGVLAQAQRDDVRWTVVQGHVPILEPVRSRGSSQLGYPRGERSKLWRLFETYGVDLYLAGEVHDVTMSESGGVTQLTHGGLFAFGLTNYAVLDFYDDRIEVDLRDYEIRVRRDARRLWETRAPGLPRKVLVSPTPFTIGTATIPPDAAAVERTGALLPYAG